MALARKKKTVDVVAEIFGRATSEVMSTATGVQVYFAHTIQQIPNIHLKPDIGCFVQFGGDYSGLMIINFSRNAAMEYYRQSMLGMGLPEEELAIDYASDEVVDSIGEVVNQIVGKARQQIQEQYGLSAYNNQPKAISILDSVTLTIDSLNLHRNQCRRLSFMIANKDSFHIELFIEQTEFILLSEVEQKQNADNMDFDTIKARSEQTTETGNAPAIDIDALINQANSKALAVDVDALVGKTQSAPDELDIDALIEKNKP